MVLPRALGRRAARRALRPRSSVCAERTPAESHAISQQGQFARPPRQIEGSFATESGTVDFASRTPIPSQRDGAGLAQTRAEGGSADGEPARSAVASPGSIDPSGLG